MNSSNAARPRILGTRPPRLRGDAGKKVLCVFGTRPEVIKFFPIIRALENHGGFEQVSVLTSQHTDLVRPLLELCDIREDYDLQVMLPRQSLNALVSRLLARLDEVLDIEKPDMVLVQGDTATAMAASMAAWHRQIPVGHVEAGLRSGDRNSPFPEEMNRRLVTSMSTLHFAPTARNVAALRKEGVPDGSIAETGNPVVDALKLFREVPPSPKVKSLLKKLAGQRVIVLTTHRRESFGEVMRDRLRVLREFVEARPDISLIFPVHPNPEVKRITSEELADVERIELVAPLTYPDFLHCLASAWLVVSDSGGIQEEAPSLGKPLLIIRPDTERPEAVESGIARLVGDAPEHLRAELAEADTPGSWIENLEAIDNPFGAGDSAERIVDAIARHFAGTASPGEVVEPLKEAVG